MIIIEIQHSNNGATSVLHKGETYYHGELPEAE